MKAQIHLKITAMKKIKLANTKLETFLREEKVYQKFIKCATNKKAYGAGKKTLENAGYLRISGAFIFEDNSVDFWFNLHNKFISRYNIGK